MAFRLLKLSLLYVLFELTYCYAISTMSVDLGSEFTKIGIVSPNFPMDIALDDTSERKIATIIYIKKEIRLFGNSAISNSIRDPSSTFEALPSIVGKKIDHPDVKAYQERFFYHNLTTNEQNGLLAFNVNGQILTVEELLAMFLQYIRKTAEEYSGSQMQSAVLVVPAQFNQAQRRSMFRVAKIAGLDVKQLLNVNSAVALNYGLFRRSSFDKTPRYCLFFDVGASATVATVVSYQIASSREGQLMVENPHAFIKGIGIDHMLGTNTFIDRLNHYFMEKFKLTKKKPNLDLKKSLRSWKRLHVEAEKIFKILSANTEVRLMLEELFDGEHFSMNVTRRELEEMCSDLIRNITKPVLAALNSSSISIDSIDEVVLFGGGCRVPMIQAALREVIGKINLSKGINADEAAAVGAAFQAARSTPGFRVPSFILKDSNLYPIMVTFPRVLNVSDSESEDLFTSRTLFPSYVPYPQGRSMTFKKFQSEFNFLVHYGDSGSSLTSYLDGDFNFMNITIHDALEKARTFPDYTPRGVKAHFTLDPSGLLNITEVNLVLEVINETKESLESDSTFKKITDGINSIFGGSDSTATTGPNNTLNTLESAKNESSNTTNIPETETPVTKQPILLESLSFDVQLVDGMTPSSEDIASSIELLRQLESADNNRRHRERMQNKLESNIFELRGQLRSDSFIRHSTPSERENIHALLDVSSEWYDENGYSANSTELEEKINELDVATQNLVKRVADFKNLPTGLETMTKLMVDVDRMLQIMKIFQIQPPTSNDSLPLNDTIVVGNETADKPPATYLQVFTELEVERFTARVQATKEWLDKSYTALKTANLTIDPPFTETDIGMHINQMHNDVRFYSTKLENYRLAAEHARAEAARKEEKDETTPQTFTPTETTLNSTQPTPRSDL